MHSSMKDFLNKCLDTVRQTSNALEKHANTIADQRDTIAKLQQQLAAKDEKIARLEQQLEQQLAQQLAQQLGVKDKTQGAATNEQEQERAQKESVTAVPSIQNETPQRTSRRFVIQDVPATRVDTINLTFIQNKNS
jgi:septal ring factor EnvC (AmiA/AmiB activator)